MPRFAEARAVSRETPARRPKEACVEGRMRRPLVARMRECHGSCGRAGAGLQPWARVHCLSSQGVGGLLEVVAVGLPAGGALAFGGLATLEVTGYRRCPWVGGSVHSPDGRRGVGEAVVSLHLDRLCPAGPSPLPRSRWPASRSALL